MKAKEWLRDNFRLTYDDDTRWSLPAILERYTAELRQQLEEAQEWKKAIIDAAVVNWTLTAEMENNPRLAIASLLHWESQVALDPAVSEPAAKLHERIAELERELEQAATTNAHLSAELHNAQEMALGKFPVWQEFVGASTRRAEAAEASAKALREALTHIGRVVVAGSTIGFSLEALLDIERTSEQALSQPGAKGDAK